MIQVDWIAVQELCTAYWLVLALVLWYVVLAPLLIRWFAKNNNEFESADAVFVIWVLSPILAIGIVVVYPLSRVFAWLGRAK